MKYTAVQAQALQPTKAGEGGETMARNKGTGQQ